MICLNCLIIAIFTRLQITLGIMKTLLKPLLGSALGILIYMLFQRQLTIHNLLLAVAALAVVYVPLSILLLINRNPKRNDRD